MSEQVELKLSIRKGGDIPVYRQIVEQITLLVQEGALSPGDRLPPERELSERLGTSRGTVTKAYQRLAANRVVTITQGRGTFIAQDQDVAGASRKDVAVAKIKRLIIELEQQRFDHQEISTLVHLLLMEREEQYRRFSLAAIDCNPEALSVFEEQLQHLSKVQVVKFLLADVLEQPSTAEQLAQYDLILTTSTHYSELLTRFPGLRDRLMKAAVAPSQQTVIDLASIPPTAGIAIVCRSAEFLEIITSHLREFKIPARNIRSAFESGDLDLDGLLSDCKILIVPPDSPVMTDSDLLAALRRFRTSGGRLIEFRYQFERGTLIHIEERIESAMEGA